MWMVVTTMALAGGMLAMMHTTVFPEIVESAEEQSDKYNYNQEELNAYLSSLFVFLASLS
jgi:hypothetical protein